MNDDETVVDVIAKTLGYAPSIDGLLGSGLTRIIAYNRAADIAKALGLPVDLRAEKLRRWGAGAVTHVAVDALRATTPKDGE